MLSVNQNQDKEGEEATSQEKDRAVKDCCTAGRSCYPISSWTRD